jgi:hypothetical protein
VVPEASSLDVFSAYLMFGGSGLLFLAADASSRNNEVESTSRLTAELGDQPSPMFGSAEPIGETGFAWACALN